MTLSASYANNRSVTVTHGFKKDMSALYTQTWTNPAAGSITAYLTTSAGPDTATFTYYRTGYTATSPTAVFDGTLAAGVADFPRNVVITVTHGSAVVALSGTISGTDEYGKNMSEAWSVTAGTTSKTFTGKKSFYRIDQVTVTAASNATTDTVKIGTGNVFGISVNLALASAVKEVSAGSVVTNGTFVAKSTASTDDQRGTYSPNTTPDGTKTYTIWVISDDPERSSDI